MVRQQTCTGRITGYQVFVVSVEVVLPLVVGCASGVVGIPGSAEVRVPGSASVHLEFGDPLLSVPVASFHGY